MLNGGWQRLARKASISDCQEGRFIDPGYRFCHSQSLPSLRATRGNGVRDDADVSLNPSQCRWWGTVPSVPSAAGLLVSTLVSWGSGLVVLLVVSMLHARRVSEDVPMAEFTFLAFIYSHARWEWPQASRVFVGVFGVGRLSRAGCWCRFWWRLASPSAILRSRKDSLSSQLLFLRLRCRNKSAKGHDEEALKFSVLFLTGVNTGSLMCVFNNYWR